MTLNCQRHLFEIPREIAYLNAAAYMPVSNAGRDSGLAGVASKTMPWRRDSAEAAATTERVRAAAARLIGATADDIAIVGSVSQAVAIAARALIIPRGSRILRIAGEFPSHSLEWERLAALSDAIVDVVPHPAHGDWTSAILEAIDRPGTPPLSVAALTPLHWADGARIDLTAIALAVHRLGAALVIDATQAVGAMPIDVRALGADFLAFPTYKWVLGPYSLAFLYAAPHRQIGEPLERNWFNRTAFAPEGDAPAPGARRYDRGERDDPVALPTALAGLEQIAAWTPHAIAERLQRLTDQLAVGLTDAGVNVPPAALRVPHILGLRPAQPFPGDIIERLAAEQVFVALREGCLRISPHVYNDDADIDRAVAAIVRARIADPR